jgi:hypothetical protein
MESIFQVFGHSLTFLAVLTVNFGEVSQESHLILKFEISLTYLISQVSDHFLFLLLSDNGTF